MSGETALPSSTRHLVGVWNPSYGTDIMESHILVLRDCVREMRENSGDEDDVYVWWAKIRSARRLEADTHIDDILSIENDLGAEDDAAEQEVQLEDDRLPVTTANRINRL
jgi:hypothetical protein